MSPIDSPFEVCVADLVQSIFPSYSSVKVRFKLFGSSSKVSNSKSGSFSPIINSSPVSRGFLI